MLRSIIIRMLISFYLVTGLLVGQRAFASVAHDTMVGMSDDIDCCPKKPVPLQCPKCPLMASCSAALAVDLARTVASGPVVTTVARDLPDDERPLDGRELVPPPRPPRSLV